jgi:hypothetical protein
MTPQELAEFEARGSHPAERRACILCLRLFVMDAFLTLNKTAASPENVLLNDLYENPINCEDGYSSRYCLPAAGTEDSWSGIYGHVVMHASNKLRLRQDPATRLWRVDQSVLRAQTAPT